MLKTVERLLKDIRASACNSSSAELVTTLKSTLTSLVKLISLLSTDPELARRLHACGGLQLAHKRVMATVCPWHSSHDQQKKALLFTFEACNSAPCPDYFLHTASTEHSKCYTLLAKYYLFRIVSPVHL